MIPVQKVLVRYTVTDGVLEYVVPFALYGTGDVKVSWAAAGDKETQTTLAPGSDYSVTVFRDMTGGKVTLADGKVSAGATLAIESAVPLTQELDLSNTATVDTEATEGQLDRMVQMIQQLDDGFARAVKVSATDSGTPEELLASLYKARDDAKDAATAAAASEQAAEGSKQAAASSVSQAAASAQAAATSAEAADQSRAEAAASAAAASQSATAARQSAEAAAGSEDRAAQSAASILGLQVEVATLDPGLPASSDYDPEAGILHLGIPKGDSGASAIATPTSLGSVMPQTGDEDGLSLEKDGKLRVRKATSTQRGSVLASTTAQADAVPQAGADGKLDKGWVPTPPATLFNSRIILIESNAAWTPPVTGWARVTVIGGGGGGGGGGSSVTPSQGGGAGGDQGGTSSFGTISASGGSGGGGGSVGSGSGGGGGGGAGHVVTEYIYLTDALIQVIIGAGGSGGSINCGSWGGTPGSGPEGGAVDTYAALTGQGGGGAPGAASGQHIAVNTGYGGAGGAGAIGYFGYGGGGGGGAGSGDSTHSICRYFGGPATDGGTAGSDTSADRLGGSGGAGGPGAVIIEYYDPDKEVV